MSLWGTIGKIGTTIGGIAAAPFTGGASLWPVLGTIGAGVGGAYLGKKLAGGGDGKDGDQNPEDLYTQQLQGNANRLSQTGQDLTSQGGDAIAPVMDYLKKILGQDPTEILNATRGERGRVIDQYDTARRAISQFGPRGGGTNAALASSRFEQAESLADITSNARQSALGQAASLGTSLTGLGLSAEQLASTDLNTIIQSVLAREGLDVSRRGQNMEALGGLGEALGTIIAAKMGGG
jgi:hypothetical protein